MEDTGGHLGGHLGDTSRGHLGARISSHIVSPLGDDNHIVESKRTAGVKRALRGAQISSSVNLDLLEPQMQVPNGFGSDGL